MRLSFRPRADADQSYTQTSPRWLHRTTGTLRGTWPEADNWHTMGWLKGGWALAMVAALCVMLSSYSHIDGHEAEIIGLYLLLALGFPCSLMIVSAASVVDWALPAYIQGSTAASLGAMWAAAFAISYWQWFILIPWAVRRWQSGHDRLNL
jgi:hypothetical protein